MPSAFMAAVFIKLLDQIHPALQSLLELGWPSGNRWDTGNQEGKLGVKATSGPEAGGLPYPTSP